MQIDFEELKKIPGFNLLDEKLPPYYQDEKAISALRYNIVSNSSISTGIKNKIISYLNRCINPDYDKLVLLMSSQDAPKELDKIRRKFTDEVNASKNSYLINYLVAKGCLEKQHSNNQLIEACTSESKRLLLEEKRRRKEVEDAKKELEEAKRKKIEEQEKQAKAEGYSSVAEWLEAKKEAERAAYEKLKREEERRRRLLKEFEIKKKSFFENKNKSYSYYEGSLNLLEKDLKLIAEWLNISDSISNNLYSKKDLIEYASRSRGKQGVSISNWDITRLISARCAEWVAIRFYTKLREKPQDCSVEQIQRDNHSSNWRLCDIKSRDFNIDVKNARRPFSGGSSNAEQFVKSFKLDKNQNNIIYLGTLSKYKKIEDELDNNEVDVQILGEVSINHIYEVQTWIRNNYSSNFEIDFSRVRDNSKKQIGNFIPGWMFEYPNDFYENQDQIYLKFEQLTDWMRLNKIDEDIHISFSIIGDKNLRSSKEDKQHDNLLVNSLLDMKDSIGISRRNIYLLVLAFTIDSIINRDNYEPKKWEDVLYYDEDFSAPLGLYDPETYIADLIDVLQNIWTNNKHALLKYDSFKLSGPNILKGLKRGSKPETIIAYCGGWQIHNWGKVPCGKNPIFIGESEICQSCGYLICPEEDCKTCNEYCEENKKRRMIINKEDDEFLL